MAAARMRTLLRCRPRESVWPSGCGRRSISSARRGFSSSRTVDSSPYPAASWWVWRAACHAKEPHDAPNCLCFDLCAAPLRHRDLYVRSRQRGRRPGDRCPLPSRCARTVSAGSPPSHPARRTGRLHINGSIAQRLWRGGRLTFSSWTASSDRKSWGDGSRRPTSS